VASRVARIFETALLPLGVLALVVLIWQIGPDERAQLLHLVGTVKWWFLAIVLQEVVAHAANTAGLLACLPLDRKKLGFLYTCAARLAGEGVNATMPTATVGGELLKISLLSRRAPASRVTAGISAAYASQALAQMLFTAAALPLALPALELPAELRGLKWVIVLFVSGGVVATFFFANVTRLGTFERLHGLFRWIGLGKKGSRTHEVTTKIDDAARDAREASPLGFALSVVFFFAGWAWGVVEVALVFYASGQPVDLVKCLAIESLSSFVDAVFFFVPGQMGTREIGLVGIVRGLGLGDALGLSLGLVRRARVIVWAGVGIACLAWLRRTAVDEEKAPLPVEVTGTP
jgi:uncharacterized protein (TIRG00374 family)